MFAGEMRKTYALSLIQNFPELPKGRPFPRISEADIVTGLHDLPHRQRRDARDQGVDATILGTLDLQPKPVVEAHDEPLGVARQILGFGHEL